MALRNQDIGERIAQLRRGKGNPPQPVVADAIGVSLRALQLWEAGEAKPRFTNLEALAEYYGVSEEYILTGTDPVETPNPFKLSDQVGDVRDEFREDVTLIQERLDEIERTLIAVAEAARLERQDLAGQIQQLQELVTALQDNRVIERSAAAAVRSLPEWPAPPRAGQPAAHTSLPATGTTGREGR